MLPMRSSARYPYSATGQFVIDPMGDYLEPLAALSFLAARTRRIRVGTSVLVVPLRHPLLAAKSLATIDVLSGGRLGVDFGVGSGWLAEEFEVLGVPVSRIARPGSDEYLRAFKEAGTEARRRVSRADSSTRNDVGGYQPKPVQKPHPPIWIGGHGPRVLARVARLGDGWKPMVLRPPGFFEPDALAVEIGKLHDLLAKRGRSPESVVVAVKIPVWLGDRKSGPREPMHGSPAEVADDLRRYRMVGVRHFILDWITKDPGEMAETLDRFAREVRPAVA